MSFQRHALRLASLLFVFVWAGMSQAQPGYTLAPLGPSPPGCFTPAGIPLTLAGCSGAQLQIGTGLALPIGTAGIFGGGMIPASAGTLFWPPLLIPPVVAVSQAGLISQTTPPPPTGGPLFIPAGVLALSAPGIPIAVGVFPTNPGVHQVATTISYAWPAVPAILFSGGGPGTPFPMPPVVLADCGVLPCVPAVVGNTITYDGGTKAFGGPAQFAIAPGPGAGAPLGIPWFLGSPGFRRVPMSPGGMTAIATVWINPGSPPPALAMGVAIVGASAGPAGLAQPGAPVASPFSTTSFAALTMGAGPGLNGVNPIPPFLTLAALTCPGGCVVGVSGTISSSIFGTGFTLANTAFVTKGFPWSTGAVTVAASMAMGGPETFFLSGTDMRVAGVGNISLVSGSLSTRAASGDNANRGWLSLTLPEPTAALGAAGALAMLGLCHGLVRRRSR